MKSLFFSVITLVTLSLMAQNNEIEGTYYESSGNPEGGTTFIVMPNNTFVVAYFGGIQKGTWEATDNYYTFTYHSEPKFVLYGRKNPTLRDSVFINFSVEANLKYAVRINATKNKSFNPIFNDGANCFSYPYRYNQTEPVKTIDAYAPAIVEYYLGEPQGSSELYSYAIEHDYNEYLLTGLPSTYSNGGSFKAVFENNELILGEGKSIKKSGEIKDISEEDLLFITAHTENEILPKVLEYGNEFFPYFDETNQSNLIPFTRIEAIRSIPKFPLQINKKSLFIVTCED
ncbi:hypothetical protein [Patiriisocius marinus]|uniref:hypothetical protein n=1 Tax=Patiriisocius marinus TaxID=1397112 RepID=UPI00232B13A3|nr:hypothetical protein [Patiriisocius marinus]